MRLSKFTIIKSTLLLILCCLILTNCSKIKKDPKFTAAIVNGEAITRITFDREMERIKQRFINKTPAGDNQLDEIRREVLEILIGGELLYRASVHKGIKVSKAEVTAELEKVTKQFPETETFTNTFTNEDIDRKISIERFITKEFSDTTVISDEESKKYYNNNLDDFTKPEQVMASHILINLSESDEPDTKQKAIDTLNEVISKINGGEDFASLAKEYSQDSTAANGGALGYFVRGQMVDSFEKAAFSLEKGAVSEIVESEFGLHLIKVLDKKPMIVISFDEISDKLKAYLKQQKVQKKVDSFIKQKRASAEVEIFFPNPA